MAHGAPHAANRLIDETSPYLLQHAHNPVDWYPWGPAALERARAEDKPILLSIGYSACHWCHVMERESFENEAIAALMNDGFVCIKVDREERPDLDDIYMQATLAMNHGHGGWPMTVFLTPKLEPFYAGTYFPPRDMHGRPGFPTVLNALRRAWQEERAGLEDTAQRLTHHLRHEIRAMPAPEGAAALGPATSDAAVTQLARTFDARFGGFGGAPKFPPTAQLSLLLDVHARTAEPQLLAMVRTTLDAMQRGGIYDHLGGGFSRYSTDSHWLVPHFEKMLYDNALLAPLFAEMATLLEGDDAVTFRRVARETCDWVLREMTSPEGAFYSSTDADSEGEEGKFFVWSRDELDTHLGADAALFADFYDVEPGGNWEGKSILNTPRPLTEVASDHGLAVPEARARLDAARSVLRTARAARIHPGLDDKVLTAWNGLMIGALAKVGFLLHEPRYLAAAEAAAAVIATHLVDAQGHLLRTRRAGRSHLAAVLEDYAYLADALVDLYEATGNATHLDFAERLVRQIDSRFSDGESGAFFSTADDHEQLILRNIEGPDGAIPSPNSIAARAHVRLGEHLGDEALIERGRAALVAFAGGMSRAPRAFCTALSLVERLLGGSTQIAVVGPAPQRAPLLAILRAAPLRHRLLAVADDAASGSRLPLLAGKTPPPGTAQAFVCRDFTCSSPTADPVILADQLAAAQGELSRGARSLAAVSPGMSRP